MPHNDSPLSSIPDAAIFCIYEAGELQVALPIAKALRNCGTARVLLLADRCVAGWENCCKEAHDHDIATVLCQDIAHAGTRLLSLVAEALHMPRPERMSDIKPCPFQEDPVLNDERVRKARRKWGRALSTALTVVDMLGAEALFLGGSNNLLDTPVWVEAARLRAVPSIVVGIGEAMPDSNIHIFSTSPAHIPTDDLGQWVVRRYPHWAATFHGQTVLACPAAEVVALEELGLAASMPWQYNAGNQDALVVSGEYIRNTFVEQGFDPGKVSAAGHPTLDVLYGAFAQRESLRQEWAVRLGLDPAKPVVLCLLPNNKTRSALKASFGGEHTVLAHMLGRCWHAAGWNVLLSPHVASNAQQFPLLQSPHWHVLNFPAADLITWVDAVVGYGSSVEYWVRALGIPNVSYCPFADVHFITENTDGNFCAENYNTLATLAQLLGSPDKLPVITAAARSTAEYWGLVDGKSTERIVELSMNLLSTLRAKNALTDH